MLTVIIRGLNETANIRFPREKSTQTFREGEEPNDGLLEIIEPLLEKFLHRIPGRFITNIHRGTLEVTSWRSYFGVNG